MSTDDTVTAALVPLASGSRQRRDFVDLVSTTRFSVSLLTPLICIASAIGTMVKQYEARTNVMNPLEPWRIEVFTTEGLTNIYSTSWFLWNSAFWVLFMSLCNVPRVSRNLRYCKKHSRSHVQPAFYLQALSAVSDGVHAWASSASVSHEQRA